MLENLAPKYIHRHKNYVILWFESSNNYVCISHLMADAMELFLVATNTIDFQNKLLKNNDLRNLETHVLEEYITHFLSVNNSDPDEEPKEPDPKLDTSPCNYRKSYNILGCGITLYYDLQSQCDLVHHDLSHYADKGRLNNPTKFWLYQKGGYLYLYKGYTLLTRVLAADYHYIQGKFKMHVLCALHNNEESDWIATMHASAIALNHTATLLIGHSGSGKTTLTGLMLAKGFSLVADDLTPLKSDDLLVYSYPGALSVKQGSMQVLGSYFNDIAHLKPVMHHPEKGAIHYFPVAVPATEGYRAKQMVLVHYKAHAPTQLKELSVFKALEILIPESWLSHQARHARQFLNWLDSLDFYELTYSNTDEAFEVLKQLHN